jgi:ABC-type proline/glycine betaine transport system substrate-binding protein
MPHPALTNAVNRALDEGSPLYVHQPEIHPAVASFSTNPATRAAHGLQPFPTAEQTIEQLRSPQLQAVPALTITEVPCVATDEEIAESAATMTAEEAADVAQLPTYIDLTPESLKTPEGAAKVQAAMEAWEATHADVANLATQFINDHGDRIAEWLKVEDEWDDGEASQDLTELRAAMDDRSRKQDAFLRAIAGR